MSKSAGLAGFHCGCRRHWALTTKVGLDDGAGLMLVEDTRVTSAGRQWAAVSSVRAVISVAEQSVLGWTKRSSLSA